MFCVVITKHLKIFHGDSNKRLTIKAIYLSCTHYYRFVIPQLSKVIVYNYLIELNYKLRV